MSVKLRAASGLDPEAMGGGSGEPMGGRSGAVLGSLATRISRPSERPASLRAPKGEVLHLLVVDDEPAVLRALERSLSSRYAVTLALGGQEALDLLASDHPIDFVLCDLMMPEPDGMVVYESVLRLRPELARRFVVMTGGTHTKRGMNFLEQFEGPVLFKPFASEQLVELVEEACVVRT